MKQSEWNEGLNNLDSDIIENYIAQKEEYQKKRIKLTVWTRYMAVAACIGVLIGSMIFVPLIIKYDWDKLFDPTFEEKTEDVSSTEGTNAPSTDILPDNNTIFEVLINPDNVSCTIIGVGSFKGEELVINSVNGYTVTAIGDYAFSYCKDIKKVVIEEGLDHIGAYAFADCSSIESIKIPYTVRSIDFGAFNHCDSLTVIEFGGTRLSWHNAYRGDPLYNVTVNCIDGVYAVDEDGNLDVTSRGLVYRAPTAYSGNYYVYGIGTCSDKYLNIPGKHDDKFVKAIAQNAFNNNDNITGVTLASGVLDIFDHAFFDCDNLMIANIEYVKSIKNSAFKNCDNLGMISVGTNLMEIGDGAFRGCKSLETIYFSGFKSQWDSISKSTNCFEGAESVSLVCRDAKYKIDKDGQIVDELEDSPSDDYYYSRGLEYLVNEDGKTCTVTGIGSCEDSILIIGGSINGYKVTKIAEKAFYKVFGIEQLIIADNVTYIGSEAFAQCSFMKSVEINAPIQEMGIKVFYNSGVISVNLDFEMSALPSYTFYGCSALQNITLPKNITKIESSAFENCVSLKNMPIPSTVTSLGLYSFRFCSKLATIEYEGSIAEWHKISKDAAFVYVDDFNIECNNGIVSFEDLYYAKTDDGNYLLGGVGGYKEKMLTVLPEYNGKKVVGIAENAFAGVSGIEHLIIDSEITFIGDGAFKDCDDLLTVEFGGTPDYLGKNMFSGTSVYKITFNGTQGEWNDILKYDGWHPDRTFIVHCTDGEILCNMFGEDIEDKISNVEYEEINDMLEIVGIGDCTEKNLYLYSWRRYEDKIYDIRRIAAGAFKNVSQIESVTISMHYKDISQEAFRGCTNLKTVIIESNVVIIRKYAFADCPNLERIIFKGTVEQWNSMGQDSKWHSGTTGFVVECYDGNVYY